METMVIVESESLFTTLQELLAWAEDVDLCVAWVNSSAGLGRHWKELDLEKVRRAVVGTAFAQTEPAALLDLNKKAERLRLAINSTGTFHPKVILARRGSKRRALVGSANFTTAAYTSNTELTVLLSGSTHDSELLKIEQFIDSTWAGGVPLDDDWLAAYTLAWKAARRQKIVVPGAKLEISSIADLDMPWAEYVRVIRSQEGRQLANGYRIQVAGAAPSYFEELRLARAAFRREPRFENLTKEERDLMMGIGRASSGLLGSMQPAGYAKGIVNRSPEIIGRVLNRVPLNGHLALSQAADLLDELTQVKGIKIGVATRFFAVKRPDLFVSVNNGSKPQLATLQNGREVRTVPHYIELLDAVWRTEWHRSSRPTDAKEGLLWDRRAALLDAALYESV